MSSSISPSEERSALNTKDTASCLVAGLARNNRCLGVFPADYPIALQDDSTTNNSVAWVMNTAPSDHPGLHWVAYYRKAESKCAPEFFDSVGLTPAEYALLPKGDAVARDSLQSLDSNVCGQYCVFYLCQRSRGLSRTQVLALLKSMPVKERERRLIAYCAAIVNGPMKGSGIAGCQCCTSPKCFCTHQHH